MTLFVTKAFALRPNYINCWIKHDLDGLASGTILRSEDGRGWRVLRRQLWMNAGSLQKRFSNETENWGHISFVMGTDYEEAGREV